MVTRLVSLSKHAPGEQALKLRDVQGIELVITDVTFGQSEYGKYVLFTAHDEEQRPYRVITSAMYVLPALMFAVEQNLLPVAVKFIKVGNAWYME